MLNTFKIGTFSFLQKYVLNGNPKFAAFFYFQSIKLQLFHSNGSINHYVSFCDARTHAVLWNPCMQLDATVDHPVHASGALQFNFYIITQDF